MKNITIIKKGSKSRTYKNETEASFLAMLRSSAMKDLMMDYREEYILNRARGEMADEREVARRGGNISTVCFAGELKKQDGKVVMKNYNGLVLLEVNNLRSVEYAKELRKEVATIPYTRMTFVGASAYSVKIVCGITSEGGFEGMDQEQILRYHRNAYRRLHYIYSTHLGLSVDNVEPSLESSCLMSYDSDAYFNPDAEMLFARDEDKDIPEYKGGEKKGSVEFGSEGIVAMSTIFEWCLHDAIEKARIGGFDDDVLDEATLSFLADYCHESNLPMDYAVMHTTWKMRFERFDRNFITAIFANAYEEDIARAIPYKHIDKHALMAYKTEAFLNAHYELRRNVMNGAVQYRRKNGFDYDFHVLTDAAMYTMTNEAIKQGIGSWDKDMRRIVKSDSVPAYDPVSAYMFHLPEWDGKDRVSALIARIPSDCPDMELYMHTWLLSMVAHWLGKDCLHGNALVPILIGGQGCGKTSFCSIILPPQLREYYNDRVEFKNETSLMLALSSFALINVDEFDAMKKSQQPVFKYLVSTTESKLRLPFKDAFERRRRYASFIATTNIPRPIVDRTGSRRFVCIKVTPGKGIDFKTPIEYDQLYAQLLAEVNRGMQYWLDDEQTARLMQQNLAFMKVNTLQDVIDALLSIPTNKDEGKWVSPQDIADLISSNYPEWNITKGIANEIGKCLRAREYEHHKGSSGIQYFVHYK